MWMAISFFTGVERNLGERRIDPCALVFFAIIVCLTGTAMPTLDHPVALKAALRHDAIRRAVEVNGRVSIA